MKRLHRLRTLKTKLTELKAKADNLRNMIIGEDGKVNFSIYTDLNSVLTDISLTKKKITFAEQGKSYLGEELSNATPRVSTYD